MPFSSTNALSFHNSPTQSQPDTPTKERQRSMNGNCCVERKAKAHRRIELAIHLIYQSRPPFGVALL